MKFRISAVAASAFLATPTPSQPHQSIMSYQTLLRPSLTARIRSPVILPLTP